MKNKVIFAIFALACALRAEAKIGTQIGNVMARKTTSLTDSGTTSLTCRKRVTTTTA